MTQSRRSSARSRRRPTEHVDGGTGRKVRPGLEPARVIAGWKTERCDTTTWLVPLWLSDIRYACLAPIR